MVVLSKEKAEFKQNWERILTICNEGGTITGKVKAIVKGGLLVNIGVEAFLPASQIDIIHSQEPDAIRGQHLRLQGRQDQPGAAEHRAFPPRTDRAGTARTPQKLLAEMTPGDIRKGTVKNITDFGAFIDLNGIDGLLHITDMSWGRIGHPSEMLKVGQDIDVVVLDINREKERVSLGLKQKLANPWDSIEAEVPGRRQGQRQGGQPGALRRVCGIGTRRRRPGARHRIVLDQAHRQAVRRAQAGPGNRGRRSRHQPRGAEDLPRHCASSKPIRGIGPGEVSARHPRQRQDPQPHQLRRLHRARRRPRRHDPRLRYFLDPQDQSPLGSAQEGRRSRSRRAGGRQDQPAHRASA